LGAGFAGLRGALASSWPGLFPCLAWLRGTMAAEADGEKHRRLDRKPDGFGEAKRPAERMSVTEGLQEAVLIEDRACPESGHS